MLGSGRPQENDGPTQTVARIVELQGSLQIFRSGASVGVTTQSTNQDVFVFDRLITGDNSRVGLSFSDQSVLTFGALTEIEILPPHESNANCGLNLVRGILSFFHRAQPGRLRVLTRGTVAGIEGTEFVMEVDQTNELARSRLSVVDGKVNFSNEFGGLVLTNNQQAIAQPGKVPLLTSGFIANNILQWCFYYPAILDLDELELANAEQTALAQSLIAYRAGDILAALAQYPAGRQARSAAEKIYYAALLLSVGQVEKTEAILAAMPAIEPSTPVDRIANSLRRLIAAVKHNYNSVPAFGLSGYQSAPLSTELLAGSYFEQSMSVRNVSLRNALELARKATLTSPSFGFAWARLAELEFSFGNTSEAMDALNRSLALTPRNAQALTLQGFLLAARNRTKEAIEEFDRAISIDSALGNAWLGRGLCKIRQGDKRRGNADLLVAAALEPQRALLRSYLGKAYANVGDTDRALRELDLAKGLDPADPTPWLYSAFHNRENNRVNRGIADLERSLDLNDNRRVYRSGLLLDQDRAVRGSSLAGFYENADMGSVGVLEAARAVGYDYANFSSHQFLAESYNALRDPTRFNLRYETLWLNEWLLANLLAPVGGTPLGQNISQQEYGRFFEKERFGLVSQTEFRSDGQLREVTSQFGRYQDSAYAIDLDYQLNDGVRVNNQLDRLEVYSTFKQQLTQQDSVMLLAKFEQYDSGDNFQDLAPSSASTNFYYREYQSPGALLAGYHREWGPGLHTLALGGRLANDQRLGDLDAKKSLLFRAPDHSVLSFQSDLFNVKYQNEFQTWIGELNQIFQNEAHTLLIGGRVQSGDFDTYQDLRLSTNAVTAGGAFPNLPSSQAVRTTMERISGYAYWMWEIVPRLRMTPGIAYDYLKYPVNFRNLPVSSNEESMRQISPKAGLVWNPRPFINFRGAYLRSVGGVSYDESYRLEPGQINGFNQAFRTLMPETLVGSVSAPRFETTGFGVDFHLPTRTYFNLELQQLESKLTDLIGIFESDFHPVPIYEASSLRRNLAFRERSATFGIHQLAGEEWSFGLQYQLANTRLEQETPQVPSAFQGSRALDTGTLHRMRLSALFNHPSGWFAGTDLNWYLQQSDLDPYVAVSSRVNPHFEETFPQLNCLAGYRWHRQRAELAVGLLNVTGENYRLNPVNLYTELPRERVAYLRLRVRF